MRPILVTLACLALAVPAGAQNLDLADPAPPLTATTWVKGGPVDLAGLQGKGVAVVAFWTTWCAPAVRAIDTLTGIQKKYADRGVVVVGFTLADPNNPLEKVRAFVESRAAQIGYPIAFEEGETTWKAWMVASGQKSLATTFLVDREGRVAWIGDPRRGLERVIEDLLAGRYSAARARRIKDLERRIEKAFASSDWGGALSAADELAADSPGRGNFRRYQALLRLDRAAEALAAARKAIDTSGDDAEMLLALARSLAQHGDTGREYQNLSMAAFDRLLPLDPESIEVPTMKFDLLLAWGRHKEAQEAGAVILQRLNDAADPLNNFAWGLLTEDSKKGKFNPLALLAANRAVELTKGESWYILDTLALARFEMGEVAEAVRLEEKAIELARRDKIPEPQIQSLTEALARYRKGK